MKHLKLYFAIIFAYILCGCTMVYYPDRYISYLIENKTDYNLLLYTEPASSDHHLLVQTSGIPMGRALYKETLNKWINMDDTGVGTELFANDKFIFSLHLPNEVKHTYSGELIQNDFRDVNSWQVEEVSENDGHTPHIIYTYTFTQEDYDLLTELHTQESEEE